MLPLLIVASGCVQPQVPGSRLERPAFLASAQAAVARDDWDDAAVLLGRFLREQPDDPWALQARYLLGAYYLKERELDSAEREFAFVASHAQPSRLARQAQLRVGDVALAGRDFYRAGDIYTRLLQNAKQFGDTPELTFKLGLVRQREGRWRDADSIFQGVRERCPESVFATRAAEQMTIPHHFALQVGAFENRARAESKRDDLAGRGHDAAICAIQRHGRALYCVQVGAFDSHKQALDFQSRWTRDPDLRLSDVVP